MRKAWCGWFGGLTALGTVLISSGAAAATYEVGPGKPDREIADVVGRLNPGDVVEVQGGATYAPFHLRRSGTEAAPITLRGIRVNGARPIIEGGDNTAVMNGSYSVLEGFEIRGGEQICVVHKANRVTLRDLVIHDCTRHGILGTDSESGSLLMEYVEVYAAGVELPDENLKHPVYIATDETMYPGSVFRMQHCYVHDSNGGNSVKSRAERNEIYFNWLEGAQYYELQMIGPDGQDEDLAREDGDVVGNVFVQRNSESYPLQVGGDGTGQSFGRYRFAHNTIVVGANNDGAIRARDGVESLEMHANVIYKLGGTLDYVLRDTEAAWTDGRAVSGRNNWVIDGAGNLPSEWTDNVRGGNPGFVDLAANDLRPADGSPLILDRAIALDDGKVPNPLTYVPYSPPPRRLEAVGQAKGREARGGGYDIGALENGAPFDPGPGGTGGSAGNGAGGNAGNGAGGNAGNGAGGNAGSGAGGGNGGSPSSDDGGCGCRAATTTPRTAGSLVAALGALALWRRRRAR